MILTNKFQTAISALTTGWFITFLCLSTGHFGNSHSIHIPEDTKTQLSFTTPHEKSNDECPWTFAALMTIGESSVSDISTTVDFDELNVIELQKVYFSKIYFNINQRGPPAS